MKYLLDTNICIYYFKGQFNLREKIERIGYGKIAISEVTLAELIYGAEKSQKRDANMKVIEEFRRMKDIRIENWTEIGKNK